MTFLLTYLQPGAKVTGWTPPIIPTYDEHPPPFTNRILFLSADDAGTNLRHVYWW